MLVPGTPNSKAFSYMFSASVILSPEKSLIFPPHSIILSDLPEKNASAAAGTLYFAAFILPKTIIQSALAPLSFRPSNRRRSITSFVRFSFVIFDTHILYLRFTSLENPFICYADYNMGLASIQYYPVKLPDFSFSTASWEGMVFVAS